MRWSRISLLLPLCFAVGGAVEASSQSGLEELRLTMGRSIVIDYPADISRISTSNPEVIDSVAVTTREILLHAKSIGAATVIVWAKTGQRTFYNINVEHNLEPIRKILKETFPNENIHVQSERDALSLTGRASTKEISERAAALVAPFMKTVINNLQVAPEKVERQILLKVRYAELNHSAATSFGVNLVSTGAGNTIGRSSTGQFSAPSPTSLAGGSSGGTNSTFTITDALNIFAFRPDLNLGALLEDMQTRNILQILAEPNLVTSNGKDASYLVGGQFPIPILQGGSNSGAVTVEFKEYGNRLKFRPVLTENNTIRLYVNSEVSTIDLANAVTISGFTIPALATRRTETNVELAPGQSFVISGLLDEQETETMSKMPGLSNVPVLGILFKSKQNQHSRNDLIVLVTPEVVNPLNPGDPKPGLPWPKPFLAPMPAANSGMSSAGGQASARSASKR